MMKLLQKIKMPPRVLQRSERLNHENANEKAAVQFYFTLFRCGLQLKSEVIFMENTDFRPQIENYKIPRVVGVKAAAKEFGIAEYALRRWVKSGELPCIHCGRRILINCSVLSEFLSCQSSVQNAVAVDERGNYYKPSGSGKIRPIAL